MKPGLTYSIPHELGQVSQTCSFADHHLSWSNDFLPLLKVSVAKITKLGLSPTGQVDTRLHLNVGMQPATFPKRKEEALKKDCLIHCFSLCLYQ